MYYLLVVDRFACGSSSSYTQIDLDNDRLDGEPHYTTFDALLHLERTKTQYRTGSLIKQSNDRFTVHSLPHVFAD